MSTVFTLAGGATGVAWQPLDLCHEPGPRLLLCLAEKREGLIVPQVDRSEQQRHHGTRGQAFSIQGGIVE